MDEQLYLMKCGHVANAKDPYGNPICIICYGNIDGADVVDVECSNNELLQHRMSKCIYGDKKTHSNWKLPFFKYCPEKEYDEYYCGCFGWN